MEYSGKKLPPNFIYILNKQDLQEINNTVGKIIDRVTLWGTSHGENKLYQKGIKGITVFDIQTEKDNDNTLVVYLTQFGVRESNFDTKESLESRREGVKN